MAEAAGVLFPHERKGEGLALFPPNFLHERKFHGRGKSVSGNLISAHVFFFSNGDMDCDNPGGFSTWKPMRGVRFSRVSVVFSPFRRIEKQRDLACPSP